MIRVTEKNKMQRLEKALVLAQEKSAHEASKELLLALKEQEEDFQDEIALIEVASFAPNANDIQLSTEILDRIRNKSNLFLLIFFGIISLWSSPSLADSDTVQTLHQEYRQGLEMTSRSERVEYFTALEDRFFELVQRHPHSPELLTDWGNASLEASDIGMAAFAFERALRLNPNLERARLNSDWIEQQLPDWAQYPRAKKSMTLWGDFLSQEAQLLLLSLNFAVFLFSVHRQRVTTSLFSLLIWFYLFFSLLFQRETDSIHFVLEHGEYLRAADSIGAPVQRAEELSVGMKFEVLRSQGDWIYIRLGNGERGWLSKGKTSVSLSEKWKQ